MLELDEAELVAYLADRPSQAVLGLRGVADDATAMSALRRAAAAVRAIPHPEGPDESLPNWVNALLGDDGPTLHLDMQDHSEQAPRVLIAIVSALEEHGVDGRLEPVRPPDPPFAYDANAHIIIDVTFLATVDDRGLPSAFPEGFPIPTHAVPVIAQQSTKDTWQHAAWRRSRPFTEYPDQLRRFGCDLDPVTARDPLMRATGMTRDLFHHPAGAGSVSLYHEYGPKAAPRKFCVSVVWRPADLPRSA